MAVAYLVILRDDGGVSVLGTFPDSRAAARWTRSEVARRGGRMESNGKTGRVKSGIREAKIYQERRRSQ